MIAEATKGMSRGDAAKKIAALWAEVSEEQKAELQKRADEKKAIYEKKMVEFRRDRNYSMYLKDRLGDRMSTPDRPRTDPALIPVAHPKSVPLDTQGRPTRRMVQALQLVDAANCRGSAVWLSGGGTLSGARSFLGSCCRTAIRTATG